MEFSPSGITKIQAQKNATENAETIIKTVCFNFKYTNLDNLRTSDAMDGS